MMQRRSTNTDLVLLVIFFGYVTICPTGMLMAAESAGQTDPDEAVIEDELDGLMDQFDDEVISDDAPTTAWPPAMTASEAEHPYRIGGELSLSAAANFAHDPPPPDQTDWRGLSRLRSMLAVELDAEPSKVLKLHASGYGFYDFAYGINGRDQYTDEVLDTYEKELELTETYALLTPLSSIDFRFGRQIVVWGSSDNLRVTDILNPLDLREPGLTDLEYIRLPVTMSRIDYYLNRWRFSGMAIHEIRFDKTPVLGSDYYPFSDPLPPEETPSSGGHNTEWAFSVNGTFSGWDVAVYAADHFNDTAYLAVEDPSAAEPTAVRRHTSLNMFGAAINAACGNWLFKSEAAWQDGFYYFSAPDETFSRVDVLVGIEYAGLKETTISVELANRHINGFQDRLRAEPDLEQPDSFQSAVRVVREFLNDTLTCTLLAMTYGPLGEDGAFQRLQVEYDLFDNLEVTAGVVLYQSGDLPEFRDIGDNDRIFGSVAYHF